MKPEVKEKFVAALRSGQYKKMDGELWKECGSAGAENLNIKTMCFMGVLCDVYAKENGKKLEKIIMDGGAEAPKRVLKWAGMTDDEQDEIISRNDDTRTTFKQLAAQLERRKG